MANFINKYATQNAYDSDNTKQYPNVSYISGGSVVFANSAPATFGGLTVHYLITQENVSSNVNLFNGGGSSSSESGGGDSESGGGGVLPSAMYVDGVEETPINTWVFETVGEHIVQYEFEDNTIPTSFLDGNISAAKKVEIGDDITEIGGSAFETTMIVEATIGTAVTIINDSAFSACLSLTSVTINALTPPLLDGGNAFNDTNNCPIYVPASVVEDYRYSTATGWYTYASRIEAIQ